MKKRQIMIVALLTVLLVLTFAGAASAWSHERGAAPILDKVTGPHSGSGWYSYNVYWATSGAKPLYAIGANAEGSYQVKITRADFLAGYTTLSLPAGKQLQVYLETRKGVRSNVFAVTTP